MQLYQAEADKSYLLSNNEKYFLLMNPLRLIVINLMSDLAQKSSQTFVKYQMLRNTVQSKEGFEERSLYRHLKQ